MPKTKSSKRKREEAAKEQAAVATLPELPDELWRRIVYAVGKHSVVCASAMRLVDKWHARVLVRTQIWQAFDELMERRAKAREGANYQEVLNFVDHEVQARNQWVRHAEKQGDVMITRIAMRQCQLDPRMAVYAMRRSLQATREICKEYGSSVVAP